ncbi:MAG: aspartate aminotransferase family protein [Acidimicrobiia bacterium]|nr:aspartate aminotransferase family protein [Acidimicrobiia bacterium]
MPSWIKLLYDEPIAIERGEGSYVFDVDGTRYLDFFGGVLTTMIGHSVPEVTAAIQAQAEKVLHTSTLYLSQPMLDFADELAAVSGIPDAKVFFTTSGTEANDTALLLASNYRKSNQILAMRNSYHGRSFSAMAITGHRSWSSSSFSGLNVNFVHGGYRLRSPFRDLDDDAYTEACVGDLVQVIDMMTAGDVACMIAEPIQGVGGFATPPDGFFGAMKKELDNHDILFISDEVQTGWGRTGEHFWGYEAHGIVPDILTFAKGVGNGITLAGVVARAEVMDCITAVSFSTFGGNPLSMAAGRATLRHVLDNDLQANALAMGTRLRAGLDQLVDETSWMAEARGKGLMQALEMVRPGSIEPDAVRTSALLEACKGAGLLIGKGGLYGNVVRIAPMLNVTPGEIDDGLDALRSAASEVDRSVGDDG